MFIFRNEKTQNIKNLLYHIPMCIINTVYIIPDTRYYIYFEYRSVREKRNLYINFEIRIHNGRNKIFFV